MPNKQLFQDRMRHERVTDTTNSAGGTAYSKNARVALAQVATTGTFGDTFYRKADEQLGAILNLLEELCGDKAAFLDNAEFVTKLAVYAGQVGKMKDMPAFITAYLLVRAKKAPELASFAEAAFHLVIRNGRMVRNLVMFLRSGTVLGNKSLGTRAQRLIAALLNKSSDQKIINWSVGNDPSLADVIKLARPNPEDIVTDKDESIRRALVLQRRGLYGWVIGKEIKDDKIGDKWATRPPLLDHLLKFQKDPASVEVPDVEFRLLTSTKLPVEVWRKIALNMGYNALRMNLQAFHKQGVFDDAFVAQEVANRLRDPEAIARSNVFPYQLWTAANQLRGIAGFPRLVSDAMEDAVDIALDNIPIIKGNVAVCIDISGSMSSPITGYGSSGRTTVVRCVDVAALIAAGITRKNPDTHTFLFNTQAQPFKISHRDSVTSNAKRIADKLSGGTDCGAALHAIETAVRSKQMPVPDLVIMVSDNESWLGHSRCFSNTRRFTPALEGWQRVHALSHRKAKFICLDLTPNTNQQVPDAPNRITVGGFSDDTFKMIADLYEGHSEGPDVWIDRIMKISLDPVA